VRNKKPVTIENVKFYSLIAIFVSLAIYDFGFSLGMIELAAVVGLVCTLCGLGK
jgi:succinate-acetate transporter protein